MRKKRQKIKILLAEDNYINQQMALKVLEKQGHRVEVAGNGKEALDLLGQGSFDLVLMDVQMPVMDGLEATREIRNMESDPQSSIPIIAMTAHAMKGDREKCLEAGMDDYISKPIDFEELIEKVAKWHGNNEGSGKNNGLKNKTGHVSRTEDDPPVDVKKVLERAMGDKAFLEKMLKHFTENAPLRVKTIEELMSRKDTEKLEKEAHTLKGAAANMSIDRIASIAFRLEQMGRDGDLSNGGVVLHELKQELQSLNSFLSQPECMAVEG